MATTIAPYQSGGWVGVPGSSGTTEQPTNSVPMPTSAAFSGGRNPNSLTAPERDQLLQNQLMAQYNATGPRTAPSATAAQASQASQAGYQAAGSGGSSSYTPYASERAPGAQQAAYSPFSAVSAGPAAQVDMTQLGQAALVRAPNINATLADYVDVPWAERVTTPTVLGVTEYNGQVLRDPHLAEATTVGMGDALRSRQMELLDYLEGAAKGTNGPSAAEMQFQRNLDKSIAAQHAQAANARGTGRVSANLQAGYNIGELSQDAAAQSAMLRAQEQQQARGQLLAGLESTRGQDISVETANANLKTAVSQFNAGQINQTQLAQAQLQQQAAMHNQDLQAQKNALQAQIDLQGGMFNADQENQMNRLQAQIEANRQMFNAGQQNDIAKAQAGMQLQAGTFNAGSQNAFRQQQAALNSSERQFNAGAENQVNLFNTGQQNQVGMFNAGQYADTSRFNAGQTNSVNMFNTGQQNQVGLANAQNSLQNSQFNIGQTNQLGMFNAGQFNQNQQFNTGQTNQVNVANAGLQNQVNLQNADAVLRQRALDDAQKQALMNQYLQATQLQQNAAQWEGQYAQNKNQRLLGFIGNSLGAGSGLVSTLVSDERTKTDVKPLYGDERGKAAKAKLMDEVGGKGDDVERLLDNLTAYKFRYKDPSQPGTAPGERYGIMAQDLERSPMGASIVVDDGGRKKIDAAQAVGVLLAAMSRMNQRLKKAEGRR
ncbi:MAG: tail fiber domain-containing protein [Frankia sp.]|nr:tail fiber domain-containing protein [Frankia sp.]